MLTRILGFSMFASVLDGDLGGGGFVNGAGENGGNEGGAAANAFITTLRLFLLGTLIETGRRLFQWVVERFKFFRVFLQAPARNSS